MAIHVFIDWRRSGLSILARDSSVTKLAWKGEWPDVVTSENAESISKFLRAVLGPIAASEVRTTVAIPREDCVLRTLDLPVTPEEEVPNLVRFQAAGRSAVPIEQLLLDYWPQPLTEGATVRRVLMATLPVATMTNIRKILALSGLSLVSLTISSQAAAEAIVHLDGHIDDDGEILLAADASRLELVLVRKRQIVFAHTARRTSRPESENSEPFADIAAEMNRAIISCETDGKPFNPQQIRVVSDVPGDLAKYLGERFGRNTKELRLNLNLASGAGASGTGVPVANALTANPSATGNKDTLAWLVVYGLAEAAQSPRLDQFDFLNPRRPPAIKSQVKQQRALAAAGALVAAALYFGVTQTWISSLDQEIADLTTQSRDLKQRFKLEEPNVQAATTIADWLARGPNTQEMLAELHSHMQGTADAYLSQLSFETSQGDVMGRIQAVGQARDRSVISRLDARLVETQQFRVKPHDLTQSSTDPDYPTRFELDISLLPVRSKPGAPPASVKTPAASGKTPARPAAGKS